jgi:hypothetical protein
MGVTTRGKRGRGGDHLCENDEDENPPLETAADTQNLTQLQVGAAVEPGGLFSPCPTAVLHGTAIAVLVDQPPWGDEHSGCEARVDLLSGVIQPIRSQGDAGQGTHPWQADPTMGISTQDYGTISPGVAGYHPDVGQPEIIPSILDVQSSLTLHIPLKQVRRGKSLAKLATTSRWPHHGQRTPTPTRAGSQPPLA